MTSYFVNQTTEISFTVYEIIIVMFVISWSTEAFNFTLIQIMLIHS